MALLFRKNSVMSLHHVVSTEDRASGFVKYVLLSQSLILCLSDNSRSELLKLGLDGRKLRTFTYWVDHGLFLDLDKQVCKEKVGLAGKFVVLFVGRLIREKGVSVLLKVAEALIPKSDVVFLVIGEGPLLESTSWASKTLGNLRVLGRRSNGDLPFFFGAADVTIVPSINKEGFGRVIIESLSCGTPVIGSRRGGIPEALDSSVGILVEPEPKEISDTILRLYEHPEALSRLAGNCRKFALTHFSERNADAIIRAYGLHDRTR